MFLGGIKGEVLLCASQSEAIYHVYVFFSVTELYLCLFVDFATENRKMKPARKYTWK